MKPKELAERNAAIWQDWQNSPHKRVGVKQQWLADKYGTSTRTVRRVVSDAKQGKGITYTPTVDERASTMIAMLREVTPEGTHFAHTLESVGDAFGISRERVRQIVRRYGLMNNERELHVLRENNAPDCPVEGCTNKRYWSGNGSEYDYSVRCRKHRNYSETIELTCENCGRDFTRQKSKYRLKDKLSNFRKVPQTNFFCSKWCQGAYAGKHYGFAAHPENIKLGIIARHKGTTTCHEQN